MAEELAKERTNWGYGYESDDIDTDIACDEAIAWERVFDDGCDHRPFLAANTLDLTVDGWWERDCGCAEDDGEWPVERHGHGQRTRFVAGREE